MINCGATECIWQIANGKCGKDEVEIKPKYAVSTTDNTQWMHLYPTCTSYQKEVMSIGKGGG